MQQSLAFDLKRIRSVCINQWGIYIHQTPFATLQVAAQRAQLASQAEAHDQRTQALAAKEAACEEHEAR